MVTSDDYRSKADQARGRITETSDEALRDGWRLQAASWDDLAVSADAQAALLARTVWL